MIAIYLCSHDGLNVKQTTMDELVNEGVLLRTKSGKLTMSKDYRKLVSEIVHHDDRNGEINGEINSLSGSLREVYMIVKNNPGIKIKKVAELRKKSESTAAKQLADLKKKPLVEYRGANKTGGYYVK